MNISSKNVHCSMVNSHFKISCIISFPVLFWTVRIKRKTHMKRRSVIFIFSILMFAVPALGQSGAGLGSISGVVQDASKAAVPGASVVISNEAKGIRRSLETNGQGV